MMNRGRVTGIVAGWVLVGAAGCGSADSVASDVQCGAGSEVRDGACVVESEGGAMLDASGSDGAEEQAPDGDSPDASADGGADADAKDTGDGGSGGWQDDPCPATAPAIDCSGQCDADAGSLCGQAGCNEMGLGGISYVPRFADACFPLVIRTASGNPNWAKCNTASFGCNGTHLTNAYSGSFENCVRTPGKNLRARVNPPWVILASFNCVDVNSPPNCRIIVDPQKPLDVATVDPNPPAVNIVIDEVDPSVTCP